MIEEDKSKPYKRLFRSKNDRMLWGVCGGLANYFEVDSMLLRVLFVLSAFFGGFGLFLYVVLAIFVPEEGSTEPVTKETVRKNAQEFAEEVKTHAAEFSKDWKQNEVKYRHHGGGHYWAGIIVLTVGVLLLLANFGLFAFSLITRFWPVILILIGFAMLTKE